MFRALLQALTFNTMVNEHIMVQYRRHHCLVNSSYIYEAAEVFDKEN